MPLEQNTSGANDSFKENSKKYNANNAWNEFSGTIRLEQPLPSLQEFADQIARVNNTSEISIMSELPTVGRKYLTAKVLVFSKDLTPVKVLERRLENTLNCRCSLRYFSKYKHQQESITDLNVQQFLFENPDKGGIMALGEQKLKLGIAGADKKGLPGGPSFWWGFDVWRESCNVAKSSFIMPSLALVAPCGLDVTPYLRIIAGFLWEARLTTIPGYMCFTSQVSEMRCKAPREMTAIYALDRRGDAQQDAFANTLDLQDALKLKGRGSGRYFLRRQEDRYARTVIRDEIEKAGNPKEFVARIQGRGRFDSDDPALSSSFLPVSIIAPQQLDDFYEEHRRRVMYPLAITVGEIGEEGLQDYLDLCGLVDMKPREISVAKRSYKEALAIKKKEEIQKKGSFLYEKTQVFSLEDEDLFSELDELIGLHAVKEQVREIASLIDRRGRDRLPCLHMAFKGNPGTAKTTVARVLSTIFDRLGVNTCPDNLVEVDSSRLIAGYVGQTAPRVKCVVEDAQGGILFIDEAYGMAPRGKTQGNFGEEALATLVKEMEDKRDSFVCIMAGYTEEMDDFIDINPGLRDRIAFHIDFPDYSAEELFQIFEVMADKEDYQLGRGVEDELLDYFEAAIKACDLNFANGRLARKVLERAQFKQAVRTDSNTMSREDIIAALESEDLRLNSATGGIGFLQTVS